MVSALLEMGMGIVEQSAQEHAEQYELREKRTRGSGGSLEPPHLQGLFL